MKLIDAHAHLLNEQYGDELPEMIQDTLDNLEYAINIAYDLKTSKEVIKLNKEHPRLIPVIGYHPNDCNDFNPNKDLPLLEELINDNVKGIGEIGLDYHYEHNKRKQKVAFTSQLQLAREHNLPVVIHTRDSIEDTISILESFKDVKVLMHSWSGNQTQTLELLEQHPNVYFSFSGVISFKNADVARETIRLVPGNRIIIETDAPWLTPEPYRGKKNKPSYVKYVNQHASKALGISEEELAKMTIENTKEFFNL